MRYYASDNGSRAPFLDLKSYVGFPPGVFTDNSFYFRRQGLCKVYLKVGMPLRAIGNHFTHVRAGRLVRWRDGEGQENTTNRQDQVVNLLGRSSGFMEDSVGTLIRW